MTEIEQMSFIKRAIRGDSDAFERLVKPYERKMYALAFRMCGNAEDASDCLQDAMLRIYRGLGSFKGEAAFSTWIYRIQVNVCRDFFRKLKHRRADSLDAITEKGRDPVDTALTPDESAENADLKRQISNAIQQLPEDMRETLVLREIQGCSYEEIAQILDINIGTVKSRINRAREKLRNILSDETELL